MEDTFFPDSESPKAICPPLIFTADVQLVSQAYLQWKENSFGGSNRDCVEENSPHRKDPIQFILSPFLENIFHPYPQNLSNIKWFNSMN